MKETPELCSGGNLPAMTVRSVAWSVARAMGLALALCSLLASCAGHRESPPPATATPPASQETMNYDADSWQTLIPAQCTSYSDGCNLCNRNPESGMTACTRKACATYGRPECLDEVHATPGGNVPDTRIYRCSDGQRFVITADEYVTDTGQLTLREDQLMLSDQQTRRTTLLTRVASASGARYKGDDLEFWSKDNEAMLMRGGIPLYWNCVYP